MYSNLRLLAVHAHPDDESSKGAASAHKYVTQGVEVLVVSCTGGERGSVLNPLHPPVAEHEMGQTRRREMAAAAEILGIQHKWLGYVDSGMPEDEPLPEGSFAALPLAEVTPSLADVIREFRPHVVTTYDELGGYPHPDHIRTHEITMAAVTLAASNEYQTDLRVWQVLKIYYHHTFSRSRVVSLHDALISRGLESKYEEWLAGWDAARDSFPRVTTRVNCADYFAARDAALRAHATQVNPDGMWFSVPSQIEQEVWPTEDFELAWSAVATQVPESDLFEGILETLES